MGVCDCAFDLRGRVERVTRASVRRVSGQAVRAFWFCCAMLWSLVSAPTGIVRTLDRFDMAV